MGEIKGILEMITFLAFIIKLGEERFVWFYLDPFITFQGAVFL